MTKKNLTILAVVLILVGLVIGVYVWSNQKSSNLNPGTSIENCTTYGGVIEEQCTTDYIGLTQKEATSKAKNTGLVPKITQIDGKKQLNSLEGSTPIYFEIEDGIVSKAHFEQDVPATE
jgi:hypothetical protein